MSSQRRVTVEAANLGEAYLELLAHRGVDCLFANAGTEFSSLVEGFAQRARRGLTMPRPVAVAHEITLLAMAHGYYLATGRPQVAMVHASVGSANGIGSIINASRARVPIIFVAGRTPVHEDGVRGCRSGHIMWAQESFDQAGMLREFVKWDYELRDARQLEAVLDRAMAMATSEPQGPVYLTVSREQLLNPLQGFSFASQPRQQTPSFAPDPERLARAAEALLRADNPLIITSAAGRTDQGLLALVRLSEACAAGVITLFPEYNSFPINHPHHQGFFPAEPLRQADLVLTVECDTPWFPSLAHPREEAMIIQAGIDPLYSDYPMRSFPSDLTLQGEPARVLDELAALVASHPGRDGARLAERAVRLAQRHADLAEGWRREAEENAQHLPLDPRWVSKTVSDFLGEQTVVFNEHNNSMPPYMSPLPGRYFASCHAGYLGWGLGAALGYKLARPQAMVAAVLGDGSYIFGVPSAGHLAAAQHQLPILTVLHGNQGWLAVRRAARLLHPEGRAAVSGEYPLGGWPLSPQYEKIAQAFGGHGERVERPEDLRPALQRAKEAVKSGRQALVNVVTQSPEE